MPVTSEEARVGIGIGFKLSGDGHRTLKIHFTDTPGIYALVEWKRTPDPGEKIEWAKRFTLAEIAAIGKWADMPTTMESSEAKGPTP